MKPLPQGIQYTFPPISYSDGRQSICSIPDNYIQPALSNNDYEDLSEEFNLEVAIIKAVIKVESNGCGFLLHESPPARPKILFEAHRFYKLTPKPVSKIRPDLSSPTWNRDLYKGGSAEWQRLLDAMEFDEINALKSASYGLGQIMGFNYAVAGCESVEQLIIENFAGEYWQARHMMNFIVNNNLIDALKNLDWHRFAHGYNGKSYQANSYHTKLENAYNSQLS